MQAEAPAHPPAHTPTRPLIHPPTLPPSRPADPEQLKEALEALEAQRSVLQSQQGEDIPEQVKRYRQSIFKLDYKVKKIVKERRTHRGEALGGRGATLERGVLRQLFQREALCPLAR